MSHQMLTNTTNNALEQLRHTPLPKLDPQFQQAAISRQQVLTKPQGALGELESIAIRLAHLQQTHIPKADQVFIAIFAADHGIAEENVSAFPQAVTAQMVQNFLQGGAAISVAAKQLNAALEVVDVGVKYPLVKSSQQTPSGTQFIDQAVGAGTANSYQQAAMTKAQLNAALQAGIDSAKRAQTQHADVFIGGEMGIANTTAAAALYTALLALSAEQIVGKGTGLDDAGVQHKAHIVRGLIEKHQAACGDDPLAWLQCVGGFEIAALVGAYWHAVQNGMAILVDGYICSAAAMIALRCEPNIKDYLFFAHQSAERGQQYFLQTEQIKPLLDLGLRLGEGSGAAVAAPLLRMSCALHNEMASFQEAQVDEQQSSHPTT